MSKARSLDDGANKYTDEAQLINGIGSPRFGVDVSQATCTVRIWITDDIPKPVLDPLGASLGITAIRCTNDTAQTVPRIKAGPSRWHCFDELRRTKPSLVSVNGHIVSQGIKARNSLVWRRILLSNA